MNKEYMEIASKLYDDGLQAIKKFLDDDLINETVKKKVKNRLLPLIYSQKSRLDAQDDYLYEKIEELEAKISQKSILISKSLEDNTNQDDLKKELEDLNEELKNVKYKFHKNLSDLDEVTILIYRLDD